MPSDLAISIVNHSNPELLFGCLKSIFDHPSNVSFEVWVVDNATNQNLVAEMRQAHPAVHWLFNSERQGFSANHNQVLSKASSRHVCILNDDTVVYPDAFQILVRYLDENAEVAMVGPRLLGENGKPQDSAFRKLNLYFYLLQLFPIPGRIASLRTRWVHTAQFAEEPTDVDWLLGACIVARSEAVKKIGLLDQKMSPFANNEDVDWCVRAKVLGWRVTFVPAARVVHYGGMTLRKFSRGVDRARVEFWKTSIRYMRKNAGFTSSLLLRVLVVASLPWHVVIAIAQHLKHHNLQRRLTDDLGTLIAVSASAIFDWS